MSSDFRHFIITRFNLKNKDWDNYTKSSTKILTDEWLKVRFKLFTDYCFPSVINQTNKNFEWWVYFDEGTSQEFREEINKLKAKSPLFKPIYVNGMEAFLPHIQKSIKDTSTKYVITSRLDNDDALHKDYTKFIQSKFSFQDNVAFDLINGYTLQVYPEVLFGLKKQLYNPFISLVEINDNAQSVWQRNHTKWKKAKNVIRYQERLWLTIIHDSNKVNEYTGYGKPELEELYNFHISNHKIQELIASRKYKGFQSLVNAFEATVGVKYKDLKKRLGIYK